MAISRKTLDKFGTQIVPNGVRLEQDRGRNAKIIHSPTKKGKQAWAKNPNKSDLKGFDTKDRKQPSKKKIGNLLGLGYIETDPDRFVADGYVTRQLIDSVSDEIIDLDSLKQAVTKAWKTDNSLKSFWDKQNELKNADWEALLKTGHIQKIIKNNTMLPVIKAIQKKFNIDSLKAKQVYDKMPSHTKEKLLKQSVSKGTISKPKPKIVAKKQQSMIDLIPKIKQQKSKKGNFYQRTKPQKWSKMQELFLSNYKTEKIETVFKMYNDSFSTKRTKNSLQNKIYRLKTKK